jgi:hypothetical protein
MMTRLLHTLSLGRGVSRPQISDEDGQSVQGKDHQASTAVGVFFPASSLPNPHRVQSRVTHQLTGAEKIKGM